MPETERIPTGIPGLDEMIEGGFKRGRTFLVVGGCGSGKSTLCMQYLYNGAKAGEAGVYVTLEEFPAKMKDDFARYGWELDELERQGGLKIIRIEPKEILNVIKENYGQIVDAINDIAAKRVVIDSISTIELMVQEAYKKRESILMLCEWLGKHDCTSLIISESEQHLGEYSRHGVVEFLVDGVIVLYNVQRGDMRENAIEVLKMRGTKHAKKIVPFTIENGINVFPREQVFSK
jgi:KaiC/GvpD/RAD55 family RecA-like ATPase